METLEPILSEHPFFQGLEERYFQLLLGCASNVRFEAGKFIFREGEFLAGAGRLDFQRKGVKRLTPHLQHAAGLSHHGIGFGCGHRTFTSFS